MLKASCLRYIHLQYRCTGNAHVPEPNQQHLTAHQILSSSVYLENISVILPLYLWASFEVAHLACKPSAQ